MHVLAYSNLNCSDYYINLSVAYSLKHTRDLIRAISKKVKVPPSLSLKQSMMGRPNSMVGTHKILLLKIL